MFKKNYFLFPSVFAFYFIVSVPAYGVVHVESPYSLLIEQLRSYISDIDQNDLPKSSDIDEEMRLAPDYSGMASYFVIRELTFEIFLKDNVHNKEHFLAIKTYLKEYRTLKKQFKESLKKICKILSRKRNKSDISTDVQVEIQNLQKIFESLKRIERNIPFHLILSAYSTAEHLRSNKHLNRKATITASRFNNTVKILLQNLSFRIKYVLRQQ